MSDPLDLFCDERIEDCDSSVRAGGGDAAAAAGGGGDAAAAAGGAAAAGDSWYKLILQTALDNRMLYYLRKYDNRELFPDGPNAEDSTALLNEGVKDEPFYYFIDKSAPLTPGLEDILVLDRARKRKHPERGLLKEVTLADIHQALIDDPKHIIDIAMKYNERVSNGWDPDGPLKEVVKVQKRPLTSNPKAKIDEYLQNRAHNSKVMREGGFDPSEYSTRGKTRIQFKDIGIDLKGGKGKRKTKRKNKTKKSKSNKRKTKRRKTKRRKTK